MKAYWQYFRQLALYHYHHSLARLRQLIPPPHSLHSRHSSWRNSTASTSVTPTGGHARGTDHSGRSKLKQ
jgi:hypothetical protein